VAMVADLASDPTARGLLRWWANHPWVEPVALIDWCEENGRTEATVAVRWTWEIGPGWAEKCASRRFRQRVIRLFRKHLVKQFGDFTCEPAEPKVDYGKVMDELPF
jgi:hypothetical protein